MSEPDPVPAPSDDRPPLYRDRAFWGLNATQFLGAFNDNVFKQLVLLICVDQAKVDREANLQGVATVLFAAPFILLSGFSGFLADRYSKRTIVVSAKVLEIVVMLLGLLAFATGSTTALLIVLFLMGAQSAYFGPSKYGILPELFRTQDLPRANGMILMTTFLAIIFGFTVAGELKETFGDRLWLASLACVGIAVAGTLTSFFVRSTPIAHPGLPFQASALVVNPETRASLRRQRRLLTVLIVSSVFWFIGGVVYPPAINDLGELQHKLGPALTGRLAACTGIGIAIGCLIAGRLSRDRFNARLIAIGGWGMLLCLGLLAAPGNAAAGTLLGVRGAGAALIGLGLCAGLFTVPLQVYLQARAPLDQKGRIIGTMNLLNWIGIATAGLYYHGANVLLARWQAPPSAMFAAAALLLLPVLLAYRPKSEPLSEESETQDR